MTNEEQQGFDFQRWEEENRAAAVAGREQLRNELQEVDGTIAELTGRRETLLVQIRKLDDFLGDVVYEEEGAEETAKERDKGIQIVLENIAHKLPSLSLSPGGVAQEGWTLDGVVAAVQRIKPNAARTSVRAALRRLERTEVYVSEGKRKARRYYMGRNAKVPVSTTKTESKEPDPEPEVPEAPAAAEAPEATESAPPPPPPSEETPYQNKGTLTERQLKAIMAISRALGWTPEALRQHCIDAFGIPPEELNKPDASVFIGELQQMTTSSVDGSTTVHDGGKATKLEDRQLTQRQLNAINAIARSLGWTRETLFQHVKDTFDCEVEELKRGEASTFIGELQKMVVASADSESDKKPTSTVTVQDELPEEKFTAVRERLLDHLKTNPHATRKTLEWIRTDVNIPPQWMGAALVKLEGAGEVVIERKEGVTQKVRLPTERDELKATRVEGKMRFPNAQVPEHL